MSLPAQLPLKLRTGHKTDVRTQFAALPYRVVGDKVQVCLVTTRGSGRWILPRGWPMHKQTPAEAAATEAWEEAGIIGEPINRCLGVYTYVKPLEKNPAPVVVLIYPLKVRKTKSRWPEAKERRRKWFSLRKAARKLSEPELSVIVAGFDPKSLNR